MNTISIEHPFTGIVVCGHCGEHYHRKMNHGRAIWHCHTYLTYGKAQCPAKAVPEDVLTKAVSVVLAACGIDLDNLGAQIEHIAVPEQGRLIFHLRNGSTAEYEWAHRSRCEGWDEAARQQAHEHTMKRWTK